MISSNVPLRTAKGISKRRTSFLFPLSLKTTRLPLPIYAQMALQQTANIPINPNGSILDIAGICNPQGNVLGLMPHPENHIHPHQHPQWTRGIRHRSGLALFKNGVKYATEM